MKAVKRKATEQQRAINMVVSQELYTEIERQAKVEDRPIASLCRRILTEWVAKTAA